MQDVCKSYLVVARVVAHTGGGEGEGDRVQEAGCSTRAARRAARRRQQSCCRVERVGIDRVQENNGTMIQSRPEDRRVFFFFLGSFLQESCGLEAV